MDNYESLGTIGEGTYGVVLKCRHKVTGQIVAIKKFKESDDDEQVKKTALREIKILKQLKHDNIVSLLEVFRVKGKLYLVFEYVEKTILEEIEKNPEGLDPHHIKKLMWQLVRAIHFCHQHNIIHRDIKPENLLVSRNGVLKLCDFGFARPLAGAGAKYTEYVSTRWYRAPELLVGDVSYGKAVDVWSIGCMFAEITTGLPLFPGDSDIDQLYHIIKCLGTITPRQQELFKKNALYVGVKIPHATEREPLDARFPQFDKNSLDLLKQTVQSEPLDRWTCAELLNHPFFENSCEAFERELEEAIQRDRNETSSLRKKRTRTQKQQSSTTNTGHPNPNPSSSRGTPVGAVHPVIQLQQNPDDLTESSYHVVVKSSIKQPIAIPIPMPTKPHVVIPIAKKPTLGPGYTSYNPGGTYGVTSPNTGVTLPTLPSSMTPSSSSTSTVSIDSTMSAMNPLLDTSSSNSMAGNPNRKKLGTVLPVPSNGEDSHGYHYSTHHQQPRISLTSHGARPLIPASTLYQATSSSSSSSSPFTPPGHQQPQPPFPQRPPKNLVASPYGAPTPTAISTKHSRVFPGGHSKGGGVVTSLQSSMEIYSPPKKALFTGTNSNSSNGPGSPFLMAATNKKPMMGSAIAPLPHAFHMTTDNDGGGGGVGGGGGYYVPPKTSHGGGSRRTQATGAKVGGGAGGGAKHRRGGEHESHRTY